MRERYRPFILAGAVAAAVGCSTVSSPVQTPTGSRPGDVFQRLEILGFSSKFLSTASRPDARTGFSERVTIQVPVGTRYIVPAVRGWMLAYGHTDPSDITTAGASFRWVSADHHYGLGLVNVRVLDIDAPDPTTQPPSQTATIEVNARLADVNADDPWFGAVHYTLLFLGGSRPSGIDQQPPPIL
jgi:hypothetical protein